MARKKARFNTNKINLWLDILLVLIFAAEMELRFTGLTNHEWLGLIFGGVLVLHFILHWKWVLSITRQFFRKLMHESRLNYVLNAALLVDAVVLVVTGFLISRTLGFSFERENPSTAFNWREWHTLSADLALLMVALHVAMHWKWIVAHSKKYLFNFNFLRRKTTRVVLAESTRTAS